MKYINDIISEMEKSSISVGSLHKSSLKHFRWFLKPGNVKVSNTHTHTQRERERERDGGREGEGGRELERES